MNNNNNNIPSGQPLLCQDGNIYNFGDEYYKYNVDNLQEKNTNYKNYVRIHFCQKDKNNHIKLFFSGINVSNNLKIHPNDSYLLNQLLKNDYGKFQDGFNKHIKNHQINTYFEIGNFKFDDIKSIVLDIYNKIDNHKQQIKNNNQNNHNGSRKRKRQNNNNKSCSDIENIEELIGYMSGNFNCQNPSKKPKIQSSNFTQPLGSNNSNNNNNMSAGSYSKRKNSKKRTKSKRKYYS